MPLFWLSLAFLTGLVLGEGLDLPWWDWAGLAALCLGLAFVEKRLLASRLAVYARLRAFLRLPLALVLAALMLGGARQALAHQPAGTGDLAYYNGDGVTYRISVLVSVPPDPGSTGGTLELEARKLAPLDENGKPGAAVPVKGRLVVVTRTTVSYSYGDLLELEGSLSSPGAGGESASYAASLVQRGVASLAYYPALRLVAHGAGSPILSALYVLRLQARGVLQRLLPAPESALLTGILLGIDSDLPQTTVDSFQATGTAHIWAISGFNIAIVSGLLITLFGRLLPRRRLLAVLLALGAVTTYTLLVGASPPVVRAAIMGGVGMFGPLLGRRQVGINSLAFTAAVMCLFDPGLPWSASFQLSFMATLGLVVFGEPFTAGFRRLLERRLPAEAARRIAGPVGDYLLLTLAAQLTTLPVTAVIFHRFSLSAVLANPLVLPAQPLVMILGGVALLGGAVFIPLGQALAALAWPLLAYTVRVVELLAKIPGGVVVGTMDQLLVIGFYAALAGLALGLYRGEFFRRWFRPAVLIVGAALLAGATWRAALAAPDGRLHLAAFSVGGLPAALIETPGGQFILVDGGADATRLAEQLGRRLPPFDSHLDAWLVTSRSASPLSGMQGLVEQYPPRQAVFNARLPAGKTFDGLVESLKGAGVKLSPFVSGQSIDLGSGAVLRVLVENKDGTALLVEWQNFRLLLPGGVALNDLPKSEIAGISALFLGPADLESQGVAYWSALNPAVVVWQKVGASYDAPAWISLAGVDWVELTTDGTQLWAETGK